MKHNFCCLEKLNALNLKKETKNQWKRKYLQFVSPHYNFLAKYILCWSDGSEAKKKHICEDSGCNFCHCLCVWFLQKWQFALQKRNKQYNIHESIIYINFLQIIRNSTKVIEKIRGMPRSLFYDTPSYVTMDYEKL